MADPSRRAERVLLEAANREHPLAAPTASTLTTQTRMRSSQSRGGNGERVERVWNGHSPARGSLGDSALRTRWLERMRNRPATDVFSHAGDSDNG
jgi:hypothetical protein